MKDYWKMRITNKGVSVIIASLLLIAIAVAAAILLYAFAIGYMGNLQTQGGTQMKDQLILEAYNWNTVPVLVLNLRNVGPTAVTLTTADFFINGQRVPAPTTNCPSGLQPEASCVITLTVPNMNQDIAYPVKIVLADGAEFSYSCIVGSAG